MAKIMVINAFYPYQKGESFLEKELEYLNHDITVVPLFADFSITQFKQYKSNSRIKIFNISSFSFLKKIKFYFKTLINPLFYKELKGKDLKKIISALRFFSRSYYCATEIIKGLEISSFDLIYSYWLNIPALTCVLLKQNHKELKCVSRGHRVDLYEDCNSLNYIPFRKFILNELDYVLPISDDGKNYLKNHYSLPESKIELMRLGTSDYGLANYNKSHVFRVVSCSWMRPVKRLDLLFDSLQLLDFEVEWTHIGDGETYNYIFEKIKESRKNIRCNLVGNLTNDEVAHFYKDRSFDVFVNVSESEGIPVSIMEAESFGLVIIATDVGGTREAINNNGILLKKECTKIDIANALRYVYELPYDDYMHLRIQSRKIWESNYCAINNYNKFNLFIHNINQ